MYDGDIIEDEIERMTAGMNREVPPHPDWVSTRIVEDSNESFGFIDPVPLQAQNDDNSEDDESLVNLAEEAADELLELDMEVDESTDFFNNPMPPPSQWLASLHGRSRACGKVKSHFEWEYFKNNLMDFHGGSGSDEADNYSAFRFSAFSESWNKWVDSLGSTLPEVTYKTAACLQDACKTMKRIGVQQATLRQRSKALKDLHRSHTNMDANQAFTPEFS